ncbi:nesprin-3 isoform X2 [Esox lucius]|uniref:nesprin-3 isoform X2 n=1 Tax=Esox lucius TaxID=8010 RepID=UPI0014769411|nr:nesprin-3 isoform X2 [Esox lucius]
MTQQEQKEFKESLEAALSWMQAVQEKLRINDNTQGPRAALEARLRETEKILESEHEGRVKMDMVLVAADVLLQNGDEETRNNTHVKLKDLKTLWEETCTYIIHCHSRVEWVWLHWNEYLKAFEEFQMWLVRTQRSLEPEVELQLGVKEKLWQVDHQSVLLSDVQSKAQLLERLLDEAASLHNRIQDPSVDQEAQERMQEEYNSIRDRAEERLSVLQKIAEEHQLYQSYVLKFQSWLLSKTKELSTLTEAEDTAENKFRALQALDDSVASEEQTLLHIKAMAKAVQANTSPRGAEVVVKEVEEVHASWQRLRQDLSDTGEGLKSSLDSQNQYQSRCSRLGEDIGQLRALLHSLNEDLEMAREGERIEEQMVGQWRTYTNVRDTLLAEEPQVENLKSQLKELFRFSQDSRHLSDDVLAVVKEYQSVKCCATKLCGESEMGLRQVLQDPLHGFSQWSQKVSQVLEASADVSEFSHIAMLVQNIERLLRHSQQLQERLSQMQVKRDLLGSVFGPDRAQSLLTELSTAVRNRELLHNQLLQRKGRLEGLISQTKHFDDTYDSIRNKLTVLRERLMSADSLQPDILAKKSQSDQLLVIKKDLEDCDAQITALETLVSNSPTNKTQWQMLHGDWRVLYKAVRVKLNESEQSIAEHESFHDSLLNVQQWLMVMKQKLESYRSLAGEWSVDNRQHEAERALGEFPEKELQLHQTEVQGQRVLERTSEEGRVHILRDMKHLRESWMALHDLSLNLFRLLNSHTSSEDPDSDIQQERGLAAVRPGPARELFPGEGGDVIRETGCSSRRQVSPGWASQGSGSGKEREKGAEAKMEQSQGDASGTLRAWVEGESQGGVEDMDLSDHEGLGTDPHLGGQLSPVTFSQGGSQGRGGEVRGESKARVQEEGETSHKHCLRVDEVDSSVAWRGGYGEGQEGEGENGERTTGVKSGLSTGRSPQGRRVDLGESGSSSSWGPGSSGVTASGAIGRSGPRSSRVEVVGESGSSSSGRTEEWVDEQRSREAAVVVGMGSGQGLGSGLGLGSRGSYGLGEIGERGGVGGGQLRHRGSFTPTKVSREDSVVEVLSSQQDPANKTSGWLQGSNQHATGGSGVALSAAHHKGKREFEAWLQKENDTLSRILNTKGPLSTKELKIRQNTLKTLRSNVGWGQEQFLTLLLSGSAAGAGSEDVGLEEIRYRWMLYKSKLKDVGDLKALLNVKRAACAAVQEEHTETVKKTPGLLYRVCRVALPLWLLLLALLLFAFLLPWMDEGSSCSLSNNFARSFNIMLRYDGPPPT